jgi:UDP-2,3-diacylglucosamine pyrophosphatase LpxH
VLQLNHYYNLARRKLGFPYWSLSAYLKSKVKNAVQYVSDYASAISAEAGRRNVDGVVCGHIHQAEIRDIGGVLYCNDGDWVESCTALVEHHDGRLEIIEWAHLRGFDPLTEHDVHPVEETARRETEPAPGLASTVLGAP